MLFNSLQFIPFFALVTSLYILIPIAQFRRILMFLAGCWFYMAFIPKYIVILFSLILVDFVAGIYLEKNQGAKRRGILLVSILTNIGTLFFFKYTNFITQNINDLFHFFHGQSPLKPLSIILPIGLSFHTLQSLSYVVEVFRGKIAAEKNLLTFGLYVMFYPQLVAGPIERPNHLLKQLQEGPNLNGNKFVIGLTLMTWGFFKKIFVADRLAQYVQYAQYTSQNFPCEAINNDHSLQLLFATYFFPIQIYCDFSGYTDIARGIAKTLGYDLCKNFNYPYFAGSISDFWKRWHISLSTWFRDYVYIPLGGNRTNKLRLYLNIMIVFSLSGLWHGANWTYVIWGALHGLYLIVENIGGHLRWKLPFPLYPKIHSTLKKIFVFHLLSFALIFFRAPSVHEAFHIIQTIFSFSYPPSALPREFLNNFMVRSCTLIILFLFILELALAKKKWEAMLPAFSRWQIHYYAIASAFLFFLIITGGVLSENTFIYFQF